MQAQGPSPLGLSRSSDPCVYPHPIRLRGPWDDLGGQLRRRFGAPSNLDAHERVWLLLPERPISAVLLNGAPLPTNREQDITALLRPRNELLVETVATDWPGVAMEVRAEAYLRHVELTRVPGRLIARGVVAGAVATGLELYLIADRTPADYALIAVEGEYPFALSAADRHEDGSAVARLRVDLVRGSAIWWTYEADVPPP